VLARAPLAVIVAVLSLCGTLVSVQQTLVVPLLPDFPGILNTTTEGASWLVTATLLTSAVATPLISRLADMYGKRRMMLVAMLLMTSGSVIAALSANMAAVITGRALQGFAVSLIPVGISVMGDILPKRKLATAIALMSATLGIGAALGLPLAGYLASTFGWHSIFWFSAVAGLVLIALTVLVVPESSLRSGGKFDVVGAVLLTVVLVALLLAISKGGTWGWGSPAVLALFALAATTLSLFIPFQLRIKQPLVDLRVSARRPVLLTNIASVFTGFAMFANILLSIQQLRLPLETGFGFNLSAFAAGLAMIPAGLAMVVLAPLSGKMLNTLGGRKTLIIGSLIMTVAYIGRIFFAGSVTEIIIGSTAIGIGTAIAYASMPSLIMAAVPNSESASANGINSLLRAIGSSTSSAAVAGLTTTFTITLGAAVLPSLLSIQLIFFMSALACLLAAVVAFFIPRYGAVAPA
jgi:MFS family permease